MRNFAGAIPSWASPSASLDSRYRTPAKICPVPPGTGIAGMPGIIQLPGAVFSEIVSQFHSY